MSREALIGLSVAVLLVVCALWYRSGSDAERTSALPSVENLDVPRRRSERAGELGFERLPGTNPSERLRKLRERDLPTPAVAGDQLRTEKHRRVLPPPELAEGVEDVDPDDFESLSRMALHDEDPDNRIVAAWLLASLEDEPVIPILAKVMSDPDPEVRLAAVESLSDLSDIDENPPMDLLSQALDDPDPEVRFEALSILTEIGDSRIQPLLEKALLDEDEEVRTLAESVADLEDTYEDPVP